MKNKERLESQILKLEEKYKDSGQDLSSYLDGLLYQRYLTYWDYIHLDTLLSLQVPRTHFPDEEIFIMYHQITKEEVFSQLKSSFYNYWNRTWISNTDMTRKGLFLRNIRDKFRQSIPINLRKRKEEVALHRLHIGHAGVNKHLFRFNMREDYVCDTCNVDDTIEHFMLHCSKYERQREHLRVQLNLLGVPCLTLKAILAGDSEHSSVHRSILREVIRYLRSTERIDEI